MIGSCAATIASDALATDVLSAADCLIANQVEQGYAALLAPGGSFTTALTIALTIYVAMFGYRLLLGLSSLSLSEVVPHFIKIGIVVALATSWPSYQALIFNTLFHGPEQVADVIVRAAAGPGTTSGDVLVALQSVFERLTDAAGDAWSQTPPVTVAPPVPIPSAIVPGALPTAPAPVVAQLPFALGAPQFVAAMLWAAALVMLAASVGVLLVVRIVLAMLLLLGPIFVAFALFRATRGIAEGWLRVTVKFAMVPLFALPLIAVLVAILAPLVAGFDAPVTSVRDSPALLVLLVVMVFAAVMVQAARLGGGIAGGIRLPRHSRPPGLLSRTLGAAPPAPPTSFRAYIPSRAEMIADTISSGRLGLPGLAAGGAPTVGIAPIRTKIGQASLQPLAFDNSGRLGQGYRRLAVSAPVRTWK